MSVLGEVPFVIQRHPGGQTRGSDGRAVQPARTAIPALGSVQPLKMREWVQLDLGGRVSDFVKVYTENEILTGDETIQRLPDRIDWNGASYEVKSVNQYTEILPHFKAVARRRDESAGVGAP